MTSKTQAKLLNYSTAKFYFFPLPWSKLYLYKHMENMIHFFSKHGSCSFGVIQFWASSFVWILRLSVSQVTCLLPGLLLSSSSWKHKAVVCMEVPMPRASVSERKRWSQRERERMRTLLSSPAKLRSPEKRILYKHLNLRTVLKCLTDWAFEQIPMRCMRTKQ